VNLDYQTLRTSDWDTIYKVLVRNESEIRLLIHELKVNDILLENFIIKFINPSKERAMHWNKELNDWVNHADIKRPIGDRIMAFSAKPMANKLTISFGGNHELGWSRWGFNAEKLIIEPT
jgi:hypothetical protein